MKNLKNKILWCLFINLLSFSCEKLQASSTNQGAMLFAGSLASMVIANQIHQFAERVEKDNIIGNQEKVHQYLEKKLDELQASKDINIPLLARLIYQSKGYTPPYSGYDIYIQAAHELAQLDNEPIKMHHLETALHNNKYGAKIDITQDEEEIKATTIHELGHALAIVHKLHNAEILNYVEVQARKGKSKELGIAGHNVALPIEATRLLPENEWKNKIIAALSGGIAVQVVNKNKNLEELLSDVGCSGDIKLAYNYAEKIAVQNLLKQSYLRFIPGYTELKSSLEIFTAEEKIKIKEDADRIIAECYDEAYDFINKHKDKLELAFNILFENRSISGDKLYDLWNAPKPLYDFEEGPLPEGLTRK